MTMMLRMQSCYGVQSNLFLLSWSSLLSEMIIVYPSLHAIRLDLILSNLSARKCFPQVLPVLVLMIKTALRGVNSTR